MCNVLYIVKCFKHLQHRTQSMYVFDFGWSFVRIVVLLQITNCPTQLDCVQSYSEMDQRMVTVTLTIIKSSAMFVYNKQ